MMNLNRQQQQQIQSILSSMSAEDIQDLIASQQAGYAVSNRAAKNAKKFLAINAGLVIGGTLLGGVLGGLIGANCASTKGGVALAAGIGATAGLAGGTAAACIYTRHTAEGMLDTLAEDVMSIDF